jgi:hypothetical protein
MDRCRPEERRHVYAVSYLRGDCNVRINADAASIIQLGGVVRFTVVWGSLIVRQYFHSKTGGPGRIFGTMQTRCPKCSTMVKSTGPDQWEIINGFCPELSGTQ